MDAKKQAKFRVGWIVGAVLAVLTIVEYIIAVEVTGNLPWLLIMAVVKAWLIVSYFMHVGQIWHEEEH